MSRESSGKSRGSSVGEVIGFSEYLTQPGEAAQPELLHAVQATTHALGHLRKGEFLQVPQDNYFAIIRRQPFEGISQQHRLLAPHRLLARRRQRRRKVLSQHARRAI